MPYYLYSDASIKSVNNQPVKNAYIGGMITDENGKILFSFFDKISDKNGFKCSHIDYAEAVALEIGLEHANNMGIKDIKCFTDSRHCVEAIQNEQFNSKHETKKVINSLIRRIPKEYKNKHYEKILDIVSVGDEFFNTFEIQHIPRVKNQYADNMSNYLRVFEHKSKSNLAKFKSMLKSCISCALEYDFIEEHKKHISETSLYRAQQKKSKFSALT